MLWRFRDHALDLTRRTAVMGIINVTPDSFSDGGRLAGVGEAVRLGMALALEGADILDVGGESTRPGAQPVALEEELKRVVPVVSGLRMATKLPISVDTAKAEVARQAIRAGADIINDVTALRGDPDMANVARESGAGLVLMHMLGTPASMQQRPVYVDVVGEVRNFLRERLAAAVAAGVEIERIALDPGIGFGKTLEHNLALLRRLAELAEDSSELGLQGRPILVGPSRKSFLGAILNLPVGERLEGTAAAVAAAVLGGARIIRVHDVQVMARVARVAEAIRG